MPVPKHSIATAERAIAGAGEMARVSQPIVDEGGDVTACYRMAGTARLTSGIARDTGGISVPFRIPTSAKRGMACIWAASAATGAAGVP